MICGPCKQGQHVSCVGPESCACARDRRCRECQQGNHHRCKNERICPCAKQRHVEQPEFHKIDLPRAIDVLKQIRDDSATPLHVAADISQVLVMYLDDKDEEIS